MKGILCSLFSLLALHAFADNQEFLSTLKLKDFEPHMLNTLEEVDDWIKHNQLPRGLCLVNYFEGNDSLYLLVVTNQSIRLESLGVASAIFLEMDRFRASILNYRRHDFIKTSNALFSSFFESFDGFADISDLIIIPAYKTPLIPFDLLLAETEDEGAPFKAMPFLFKIITVRYQPDWPSVFRELNLQKDKTPVRFLGVAPGFSDSGSGIDGAEYEKHRFKPLPGSIKEVALISDIVGGRILTGKAATVGRFAKAAKRSGAIHLSTHGNPAGQQEGLFFSRGDEDGGTYPFVSSAEFLKLGMDARLFVLSSCGEGRYSPENTGGKSLAVSLLEAGVATVIFSFWDVLDETTPFFMERLYRFIAEGETIEKALRRAKLGQLEDADQVFDEPFFWGGFSVMGDGGPISFKKKPDRMGQPEMFASGVGVIIMLVLIRVRI